MNKKTKLVVALLFIGIAISCKNSEPSAESEAAADATSKIAVTKNDSSSDSTTDATKVQQQTQAGQITAGEWKDLENWNFWNALKQEEEFSKMDKYWEYNLDKRISVNVKSNSDNLVDVPVALVNSDNEIIWQSRTNNNGNAELWPLLKNGAQTDSKNLKVKIGNEIFNNIEEYNTQKINKINVSNDIKSNTVKKIDIAFMVDATGSMGDELEYLKEELTDVISKVKDENQNATINLGAVFYRDNGEEYVTKKTEFSTNIDKTVSFIEQQSANAGGDFPEAVETALSESINNLEWSQDATSRILFMVLDAPPHHEDQIVSQINTLITTASKKGIKIIPITASGIDKETEFLMRYMAIATNGTYVFITNDSGIGNDHLVASVGDYQVEFLNKLMERLINESLK